MMAPTKNDPKGDSPKKNEERTSSGTTSPAATTTSKTDERQRTIAYLLFGIDLAEEAAEVKKNTSSNTKPAAAAATTKHHDPTAAAAGNNRKSSSTLQQQTDREITKTGVDADASHDDHDTAVHPKLKAALDEIDRHIPLDRATLRQSPLFQAALPGLQWQRDNYLVGTEYADWRQRDQERRRGRGSRGGVAVPPPTATAVGRFLRLPLPRVVVPYDPAALVHGQLRPILVDFIPSATVVQALTPIVAELPVSSAFLYDPIASAMIDLIQSQRTNLDYVLKDQMLSVLKDPAIRNQMKTSMQGLMINKTTTTTTDGPVV
jgi:hypothetical protein